MVHKLTTSPPDLLLISDVFSLYCLVAINQSETYTSQLVAYNTRTYG